MLLLQEHFVVMSNSHFVTLARAVGRDLELARWDSFSLLYSIWGSAVTI